MIFTFTDTLILTPTSLFLKKLSIFLSSPFVPIHHEQGRQSKSPYDAQQANSHTTPVPIQEARPRRPSRRQARRGSRGGDGDDVPPSGFTTPNPHTTRGREDSPGMKHPRTPAERVQEMPDFHEIILFRDIYSVVRKHTQKRLAARITDTLKKLGNDELDRLLDSPEELKAKILAEKHILLLSSEALGAGPPSQPLSDLNGIGEALPNVEK